MMSRLTTKTKLGDYIFIDGEQTCLNTIATKLGKLEDLMEKYDIKDLKELKRIIKWYYETDEEPYFHTGVWFRWQLKK